MWIVLGVIIFIFILAIAFSTLIDRKNPNGW